MKAWELASEGTLLWIRPPPSLRPSPQRGAPQPRPGFLPPKMLPEPPQVLLARGQGASLEPHTGSLRSGSQLCS